ncbi:transposable element Tcb2 transposase [Trichonephila clavipes]|nr:transposable element Tcb2 transposase [Trichonephila clavipes]
MPKYRLSCTAIRYCEVQMRQDLTFDDYKQINPDIAVWRILSDAEIGALDHSNTENDEDELEELTPITLTEAGRGRLTSFSVEYETGNQSLFQCAESFTKPGSGRPRQTSRWEDNRIVRNARVQPTASSVAIQAQVAPSLGAPVSSRTIRRCLAEGHLGSRRPLRVLPLTPIHRRLRLEWCRTRENLTAAEWNQVVYSDEPRFNLSSDDNRVRVWRTRGERLNPAFALQ